MVIDEGESDSFELVIDEDIQNPEIVRRFDQENVQKNKFSHKNNTPIQNAIDSTINNKFIYGSVPALPDHTIETYGDDYTTSNADFMKQLFTSKNENVINKPGPSNLMTGIEKLSRKDDLISFEDDLHPIGEHILLLKEVRRVPEVN